MNNALNMLFQMMQMGQNPSQIIQQMLKQHPEINGILNQAKQSKMSPQEFAMQYAKQNNIDLNPLINLFNQFGIRL